VSRKAGGMAMRRWARKQRPKIVMNVIFQERAKARAQRRRDEFSRVRA
jgi:hypothetical protein